MPDSTEISTEVTRYVAMPCPNVHNIRPSQSITFCLLLLVATVCGVIVYRTWQLHEGTSNYWLHSVELLRFLDQ